LQGEFLRLQKTSCWHFWLSKVGIWAILFSQPDLIIAASALHHGLTVVTRNRKDFDKAGVPVFNPWDS